MKIDKDRVQWLSYDLLVREAHIFAASFMRHGGVSSGPYATLNVADNVGDHPDSVKFNREKIQKMAPFDNFVFAKQVHGTNIVTITKENTKKFFDADVLVTKEKGIGLAITHADCQAALFYDPDHKVVAAAHIGWRGLFQDLYTVVVDHFINTYSTNPEKLLVCISPSLCPNHSEFKNYKEEVPKKYWEYKKDPHHFDLWAIAKKQLLDKDVKSNHIEFAEACTFENNKDYFSHRREKISGRNVTVIGFAK